MERWVKVVLGTLFSSIAVMIFFFIYDKIMVYFRGKRHDTVDKGTYTVRQVYRKSKAKTEDEMDQLIFDEYDSIKHEVLCVCTETSTRAAGLCIFMGDREVEWYTHDFPECCVNTSVDEDFKYRNVLSAVAHWASKFTYAEAVNLLCTDGKLVKAVGKGNTRQWRSFFQFEKKHSFRLFLQWDENYVCGEVANDELWESALLVAKGLLKGGGDVAVQGLPLRRWKTTRVSLSNECFHMVPHPGDITPEVRGKESECNDSDVEDQLLGRRISYSDERRKTIHSSATDRRSVTEENKRSNAGNERLLCDSLRKIMDRKVNTAARESFSENLLDEEVFEELTEDHDENCALLS